jgi:hypothetical protein
MKVAALPAGAFDRGSGVTKAPRVAASRLDPARRRQLLELCPARELKGRRCRRTPRRAASMTVRDEASPRRQAKRLNHPRMSGGGLLLFHVGWRRWPGRRLCSRYPFPIRSLMRVASTFILNGLVRRYMPGSRGPFPNTASSA